MVERIAIFPSPKPDISSLELTERYIERRAYELYERRGREHGRDQEDWFEAQSEIFGRRHDYASADATSSRALAA
jgi:hypothetical protein